jgi:hypothetical protein
MRQVQGRTEGRKEGKEDNEAGNEEKLGTHIGVIQWVRQQNRPASSNRLVGLVLGDGDRAVIIILDGDDCNWSGENLGVGIVDPVAWVLG